jgi:phasin
MNKEAFPQFEVPTEVRAFAEKSVEQARKAFDGFVTAATQAATTVEGGAEAAQAGAKDVTKKAMAFAEQNVASSFDFAQKLTRAQDVSEMVKLHSDYVRQQIETLSGQAKELSERATRMAMDANKTKAR